MRVCLIYDHLFPRSIGGAERWMRDLAVSLSDAGHEVTYLTIRTWRDDDAPPLPGVEIIGRGGRLRSMYTRRRRSVLPPLVFGASVLLYLARRGRRFDVVHTASFPYFPLLSAALVRRLGHYELVVDWHEVWTREYWERYAGKLVGSIGWRVQRLCVHVHQRAFCVSRLHAARLVAEGFAGEPTILPGIYRAQPVERTPQTVTEPCIVYAGRYVPEKRVADLVRAFAVTLAERPDLRLELYGDGPERRRTEQLAESLGVRDAVSVYGRRTELEVSTALARASCMATASEREGYGLVVVEAAAHGTPSVIVDGPENAAVELVEEGVNGAVAASPEPEELAAAILRVLGRGAALRRSTATWFERNSPRLRIENSIGVVLETYESLVCARRTQPLQHEHMVVGVGTELPQDMKARGFEDRS